MRRGKVAVLGAALLGLAPAGWVGAQPDGPKGPGRRGAGFGPPELMARALGLTDGQRAEVRDLIEARRPAQQAVLEQIEANRAAMEQALANASPDPIAVGELAIAGHRLREEGRVLREEQEKAVRTLLTSEQRTRLDALQALREQEGPPPVGGPKGQRGAP